MNIEPLEVLQKVTNRIGTKTLKVRFSLSVLEDHKNRLSIQMAKKNQYTIFLSALISICTAGRYVF